MVGKNGETFNDALNQQYGADEGDAANGVVLCCLMQARVFDIEEECW